MKTIYRIQPVIKRHLYLQPSKMFTFGGFNRFGRLMDEMSREMMQWDRDFYNNEPFLLSEPTTTQPESRRENKRSDTDKSSKALIKQDNMDVDQPMTAWFDSGFHASMDIVEKPDFFQVNCDLPGLKPEEVKVEVKDNILSVSGSRKREFEQKTDKWSRIERSSGTFHRSVRLAKNVDQDGIQAHHENGVLCITLPKKQIEEIKPKSIQIISTPARSTTTNVTTQQQQNGDNKA